MSEPKKSIKELVAEQVASSGETVKDRVVDILTSQVIDKRVTQIQKGLELQEAASKELSSIRPDKTFDPEGKVLSEFFTADKLGQKKKAQEKYDRITRALNSALDEGNYEQLQNLAKGDPV